MNLLTELKKIYPDNVISIKERYIKDIRTVKDPSFKKENKKDKTTAPLIQQDNSLKTYNIVFDKEETDAQLFQNINLQENEMFIDLINNVGQNSVDLIERKINQWLENKNEM